MTGPWSAGEAPVPTGLPGSAVTLVEGATFCISESGGDISGGQPQGLFVQDTRVLSRWVLTFDGRPAEPLAVQHEDPYAAAFIGRLPPPAGAAADAGVLVVRHRYIGDGMREDITIRNTARQPAQVTVTLAADADFADLFEVKAGQPGRAPAGVAATGATLSFGARRGHRSHGLLVSGDGNPVAVGRGLTWQAVVPARGDWGVTVEVIPVYDGTPMSLHHPRGQLVEHAFPARRLREWRRGALRVQTHDPDLAAVLRRSIEDIGALRIFDPAHPGRAVVAAGAPWFMALFGRDSLLTSWMLLPWDDSLAVGTLQTLADRQGRVSDPASEEEPGKILHEVRFGPAATLALGGRGAYYGTADATPLFVMLLGELSRWGRHHELAQALLPHADRALEWMRRHGDADGDGFIEYSRMSPAGLVNQGWKDSWDGVNFADGAIAESPMALAEVQGYAYAAYRAWAAFALETGDKPGARHWTSTAARLKRAFNQAFWLPDRGWYAIALDRDKRPVDALTSNIGHCLWTGIADRDKAAAVADHLLSADMFSGWGIRTLAASMAAYNPMSYHNGSVWPHDNALCAAGLMRYGHTAYALRVAESVFDAAAHFGHRLPELFCGFPRDERIGPVPYPTSCSPQAWAAAAPLQLLTTLLRVTPEPRTARLWCSPAVPDRYLPLQLSGLRLGTARLALDIAGDGWQLSGLEGTETTLVRRPRRTPGPW
ncbi:MAG TPA: glycogen debranching N-terminal domain-containing protein [Streptosporangiaceae bacterium]